MKRLTESELRAELAMMERTDESLRAQLAEAQAELFHRVAGLASCRAQLSEADASLLRISAALGHNVGEGITYWETAARLVRERDLAIESAQLMTAMHKQERADLSVARATIASMVESMGAEFNALQFCVECGRLRAHFSDCSRAAFFDALRAADVPAVML